MALFLLIIIITFCLIPKFMKEDLSDELLLILDEAWTNDYSLEDRGWIGVIICPYCNSYRNLKWVYREDEFTCIDCHEHFKNRTNSYTFVMMDKYDCMEGFESPADCEGCERCKEE